MSKTTIILPKVKDSIENNNILTFTIEDTNVSIVNALRRTILSDIETVVFDTDNDKINIINNTSRFHNEILKQRLGCIPVHIKDFDDAKNLLVELNLQNNTDSLLYVTTKDFKIKDTTNNKYLTDSSIKNIFPPDKITKQYILFTRLRPKISSDIPSESIQLNAKFKLGTAKEDGMYNVASTCAYSYTPDKVQQHNVWQEISEKMENDNISKNKIETERKNWYTLQAKRIYIETSFHFKLESIGVFTNLELIHKACDNIIIRLNKIKQKAIDNNLEFIKNTTTMKNSIDIKLIGEDYTIGKVIEYILYEQYYKKDQELSYIGFIKQHPHDDYSIIRLAFTFNDGNIGNIEDNCNQLIEFSCNVGQNIFANIKEYF